MDKVELARRWADHTVIITILFQTELKDGVCDLILDLATSEKHASKAISIRFAGISNLTLSEIGGGNSPFCRLDVADIRNQQWDRLNYKIWDSETERIEFMCRDFEIAREYCT